MTLTPTPILRLTQTAGQNDSHTIQLEWLGDGPRQVASALVDLALTEQDQQDIRWYVEEYAEYPFDPHPARAARVEARMRELGHELFRKLFGANTRTFAWWRCATTCMWSRPRSSWPSCTARWCRAARWARRCRAGAKTCTSSRCARWSKSLRCKTGWCRSSTRPNPCRCLARRRTRFSWRSTSGRPARLAARRPRPGAAGRAGRGLLRARRDAAGARSRLRPPARRAAARLCRQRQDYRRG